MAARSYTVIYQRAEKGGYYAHIPALEVTTEGETLKEAKAMARDVIESTLACLKELKLPIPKEAGCETIEVA
ncbi:MAG: type II toxin-antitoxin system HicB family antitoxin [Gemmataceae bacterium]|nr:type II toxin-antitoxin system HicB family antitoxin [Gemmataceae bacterium]